MGAETGKYRSLLNAAGVLFEAGAFDPFSARIAQNAGFKAVGFNLNDVSTALGLTPKTVDIEDIVRLARYATSGLTVPLRLDIGNGFGSLERLARATREAERAGASALTIDDCDVLAGGVQTDRAKDIVRPEYVLQRVDVVAKERRDPSLVIAVRSNVLALGDMREAVRRCKLYYQVGVDICLVTPTRIDQARELAAELGKPVGIVVGPDFREEVSDMEVWSAGTGIKLVAYEQSALLAATQTFIELGRTIRRTGVSGDQTQLQEARLFAEDAIGLSEMYEIEERTVERAR